MMFSEEKINSLRTAVSECMSKKRFLHTLGVEKTAVILARNFEEIDISEISVAAILHDISKEYSEAEQCSLAKSLSTGIRDGDLVFAVLHSITAPIIIKRDFPDFATKNVLSAVYNHTVGSPSMSIFDEIVFISDYIEPGRTYATCIDVRDALNADIIAAHSREDRLLALHKATLAALDNTIKAITSFGGILHSTTLETRDAFFAIVNNERHKNGR